LKLRLAKTSLIHLRRIEQSRIEPINKEIERQEIFDEFLVPEIKLEIVIGIAPNDSSPASQPESRPAANGPDAARDTEAATAATQGWKPVWRHLAVIRAEAALRLTTAIAASCRLDRTASGACAARRSMR
jgi:hypothetical protein